MTKIFKYSFTVDQDNVRIDHLLVNYFENLENVFSRSAIQKLIKNGFVFINKSKIKVSYKVKKFDLVDIYIPPREELKIEPENIKLRIVYEDDYLIVINKQYDFVVHPASGNLKSTLLNAVLYHSNGKISSIGAPNRYGIVHRIDKNTTGLIVVAKDDYTHLELARQFSSKTAYRKYLAVVSNNLKFLTNKNSIDTHFSRHPKDRKKFTSKTKYGKKALTIFKIIKSNNEISLIDIELKTGRTHQIRVHFYDNNCPIIGDQVYFNKLSLKLSNAYNINRQALHARYLSFIHPIFKIRIGFNCKIENDIKKIIESF